MAGKKNRRKKNNAASARPRSSAPRAHAAEPEAAALRRPAEEPAPAREASSGNAPGRTAAPGRLMGLMKEYPERTGGVLLFALPLLAMFAGHFVTAAGHGLPLFGSLAGFIGEYVMLFLAALIIDSLTRRQWLSWIAIALPEITLALVSYYKVSINSEPLMLRDMNLFANTSEVLYFAIPKIKLGIATVLPIVLTAAVLAALIFLDVRLPRRTVSRPDAALSACILALIVLTGLGTRSFSDISSQEEREARLGTAYGLYTAWNGDLIKDLYSSDHEVVIKAYGNDNSHKSETPTVIFLMSESFFDVTELDGVSFEKDPIPVFHSLEDEAISGKFLSMTYMGGTGYVEYEVQTGICSNLLKQSDTLASVGASAHKNMPHISDVFRNMGYDTVFLHSYSTKLYNRATIYEAIGYDKVLFEDSFGEDAKTAGGYISDEALSEKIISLYEERDPSAPLMIFAVSMENHQPYYADKFDRKAESGLSSGVLGEEDLGILDAFVSGCEDADRGLGMLVDYFRENGEPVMIVFWGDHLPNLSNGTSNVYDMLGYSNGSNTLQWGAYDLEKMLETDYLIWNNYGFTAADRTESSTLLGLHVLEYLDFGLTDYFRWLQENVEPQYLMYRPRLFVGADGGIYPIIPSEYSDMMKDYEAVVRNLVYEGATLFPKE